MSPWTAAISSFLTFAAGALVPLPPFLYAISTLHCLTISLAHDGAGLGTVWGEQAAREMLRDAGFSHGPYARCPTSRSTPCTSPTALVPP